MSLPLALVQNPSQALHRAPGHPERPERVAAILQGIGDDPLLRDIPWLDPDPVAPELALLVHEPEMVRSVENVSRAGGGWFDPDTYCTPDS